MLIVHVHEHLRDVELGELPDEFSALEGEAGVRGVVQPGPHLHDLAGAEGARQPDLRVADPLAHGPIGGRRAAALGDADLPRSDEAAVAAALPGDRHHSPDPGAELKRHPRASVGGREAELPLAGDGIGVEGDLERADEVVGVHGMVHGHLEGHRRRVVRQHRKLDPGAVRRVGPSLSGRPPGQDQRREPRGEGSHEEAATADHDGRGLSRITGTVPPAGIVVSGGTTARPSAETIEVRTADPWFPVSLAPYPPPSADTVTRR